MAAIYDDAKAAADLEGDFVIICKQLIGVRSQLTEVIYKYTGQPNLVWDGTNPKIPLNQIVLDAITAMGAFNSLFDTHKSKIAKAANLSVTTPP